MKQLRITMLLCASLTWSCASLEPPSPPPPADGEGLPPVVFIANGIFHDGFSRWDRRLQSDLVKHDMLPVRVERFVGLIGLWSNHGSKETAALIVEFLDEVGRLYAGSGCFEPLRIYGVGFSHGTEILLRAARDTENVSFERLVLAHSSAFRWSKEPNELLEQGKISGILSYWSPIDGATLFAPLGAGGLGGIRSRHPGAENELVWRPHIPYLLGRGFREEVIRYIEQDSNPTGIKRRAAATSTVGCADLRTKLVGLVAELEAED